MKAIIVATFCASASGTAACAQPWPDAFAAAFLQRCVKPALDDKAPDLEGLVQESVLTRMFRFTYDIAPGIVLAREWGDVEGTVPATLGCRVHKNANPGADLSTQDVRSALMLLESGLDQVVEGGDLVKAFSRSSGSNRMAYFRERSEVDMVVRVYADERTVIGGVELRDVPPPPLAGPVLMLTLP